MPPMLAALTLNPCLGGRPASIGWHHGLVVLLRFSDDDGKEKLLLPHGRLAGAIEPRIGGLPWTTQRRDDHGSGIRGERISEGHVQILPQKKKYAMQKINLAKCPQCRQIARVNQHHNMKKQNKQNVIWTGWMNRAQAFAHAKALAMVEGTKVELRKHCKAGKGDAGDFWATTWTW